MPTPYALSSDLVSAWPAKSLEVATYLDTALAAKAPSASPTFTGTVTFTGAAVVGISSGLTFITSGALSGSATSVNSCFTSTYANYRIVVSGLYCSGNTFMKMRLRASGTDDSAASYEYAGNNVVVAPTTFTVGATDTFWDIAGDTLVDPDRQAIVIEVQSPQLATRTNYSSFAGGGNGLSTRAGIKNVTTQFDSFTLFPNAGTFSGGTVHVYGYQKS